MAALVAWWKFLSTPSARRATGIIDLRHSSFGRFLSTPSARRATNYYVRGVVHNAISIHALREEGDQDSGCRVQGGWNFYPRPPRGGRLSSDGGENVPTEFLSTPSARRATFFSAEAGTSLCIFLSTPSARRATAADWFRGNCYLISIHALREEGDIWMLLTTTRFRPFLSTPSARRAT